MGIERLNRLSVRLLGDLFLRSQVKQTTLKAFSSAGNARGLGGDQLLFLLDLWQACEVAFPGRQFLLPATTPLDRRSKGCASFLPTFQRLLVTRRRAFGSD